jgi:hypothetical protein
LSAPSFMGRTAIITIALAALAVSAHGVPVTSAHAHSKAAGSQTAHHAAARQTLTHKSSAHSPAHPHDKSATPHRPAKTTGRSAAGPITQAAAHKPTPAEVGRAAGLKIRSQLAANQRARNAMDRRAVLRRSARERNQPELVRASYIPAVAVSPDANVSSAGAIGEIASRQSGSEPMSGTMRYQAVNLQPETSRSTSVNPGRSLPAIASEDSSAASGYSTAETQPDLRPPAAPVQMARRNVAPRPVGSAAETGDADTADSTLADAATPADHNAVHPSFARHAAVRTPDAATELDERVPSTREPAGENSSDYNAPEDARLRAETEEASLTIARGYMPAPLRGNRASLERQNQRLEAEGLERIEDEDDLASRIAHHLLVPVPASYALIVNGNLSANHRYCRPWTARFLSDLAAAHDAEFHRPLEVSSAVRTVAYQKRLMQVNGNAAPAVGDVVSPHMTGAAVDIAKDNLSRAEMAWMRRHLLEIEAAGKIDVEEEFQQSCFHITVYKNYLPAYHPAPRRSQTPSQAHTGGTKRHAVPTPVADEASAQGV